MEVFVDGGLFELLIALTVATLINAIYLRRSLLIAYSILSGAASVALFFLPKGDVFYVLLGVNVLNTLLLIVLLWKRRAEHPGAPLFELEHWKKKMSFRKKRTKEPNVSSYVKHPGYQEQQHEQRPQ
ncbi:hypothetical protein [Puia sp.]|jgi:hypothetical protein|uniref:hypothetical protein n=1 Tax=Puia sp. TaxID=2045100 RepID=UPI002F3EA05B